jgi:hypothetical protein
MSPLVACSGKKSDWVESVIKEHKRWEEMPNRQEPVTIEMIEFIIKLAEDQDEDSLWAAMRDWLIQGNYTGCRLSEWAQQKRNTKNGGFATWDKSIGGDGSSKAFTMEDFRFHGKNNRRLTVSDKKHLDEKDVHSVNITWRHQKNGDNGQSIKYTKNAQCPKLCPVRASLRIRRKAQRLGVRKGTPLAVFKDDKG